MPSKKLLSVLALVTPLAVAHEAAAQPATDIGVLPPSQPAPPSQPPQYQQPPQYYQPAPQYYQPVPQYYQPGQGPYTPRRRSYREGDPIPPGYHVEDKPRTGLVTAGWILLLVPYSIGAFGAIAAKFTNESALLLAPVVGPWLTIGNRSYNGCGHTSSTSDAAGCTGDIFLTMGLVVSGVLQATGGTLLLLGYVNTKEELVRDDRALRVRPVQVGSGYGLGLTSAF